MLHTTTGILRYPAIEDILTTYIHGKTYGLKPPKVRAVQSQT